MAPAKQREAFEAAFAAGADAVYMGLPKFGARAYAANFGMSEMKEVIHKAHLAGMKIYITMNTILEESEILEAAALAEEVSRAGADALIIQDLGLIHYLHHTLPEIELHASTQVSVNRPEQIEKLKQLGVTRVVLAREATLEEIKACKRLVWSWKFSSMGLYVFLILGNASFHGSGMVDQGIKVLVRSPVVWNILC